METIITSKRSALDFKEIWQYRELLYIFTWRDIKIRYKQTILGVIWVLFQPVTTTIIFSVFFGKLAKISSDGLPYPLFVFLGLTIWTFFSSALSTASNSFVSYEGMLKKVYFPRIIFPLSSILTSSFDFLITIGLLLLMCIYYRYFFEPWFALVLLPLIFILYLTLIGLSLLTSSLNVRYRDVRYILPFFIQIGMFLTPVIYPLSVLFDYRKWLLMLNPLTSVIEISRSALNHGILNLPLLGIGLTGAVVIFFVGLFIFSKTEGFFADIA